jgi:hypothetical protein
MQTNFPLPLGGVDGLKIARDAQKIHDRAKLPQPAPKPVVIKVDTVEDAIQWTGWVESQEPNPVQNLANVDEQIFDLSQRIEAIEKLLPVATPQELREINGWDEKVRPSLPGIADTYVHIPGSLERLQTKRADLEKIRPLIVGKAERFRAVVEALKPWPRHRINEIRNREVERALVAKGKPIQRRPQ